MNKEDAHLYLPFVQAWADGKIIERNHGTKDTPDWLPVIESDFSFPPDHYRIKSWSLPRHIPGFRPLEDSEEWQKVGNIPWTEDMLPTGLRPYLKDEIIHKEDQFLNLTPNKWETPNSNIGTPLKWWFTLFRTRRPLPELKPKTKLVPLSPEDILPGSIIRLKGLKSWSMVLRMNSDCVHYVDCDGDIVSAFWHELQEDYEILRPGQDWQPCHKEVAASSNGAL